MMHKLAEKLLHTHHAEGATHDEQGNVIHKEAPSKHTSLKEKEGEGRVRAHTYPQKDVKEVTRPSNPVARLLAEEQPKRVDTPIPSHKTVEAHIDAQPAQHVDVLVQQHACAPTLETYVQPLIVDEVVRVEEVIEIQPVIHRHIERREIRHIERHIYETVTFDGPHTVTMQPVIEETIQPVIIEEVTTIIHREVPETFVVREEQHLTEHVVQPTVYTKEVIDEEGTVVSSETSRDTTPHIHAPVALRKEAPTQNIRSSIKKVGELTRQGAWDEAYPAGVDRHSSSVIGAGRHNRRAPTTTETTPASTMADTVPNSSKSGTRNDVVYEPTSLDIRAQLSLERLADLQAMNSGFPAMATRAPLYVSASNTDVIEKGAQIGLDDDDKLPSRPNKREEKVENKLPSGDASVCSLSSAPASRTPSE